MEKVLPCPHCHKPVVTYKNPVPTVDIIIETDGGIVLVKRRNPPQGWALPGGFVDYGESMEDAAIREAREETGLDITIRQQLHTYSDPSRDRRLHTVSTVFIARAEGTPIGMDDAEEAKVFGLDNLPRLEFDHDRVISDYVKVKNGEVLTY